jgi:hypothetical protein
MAVEKTVRTFENEIAASLLRPEYTLELVPDALQEVFASRCFRGRG